MLLGLVLLLCQAGPPRPVLKPGALLEGEVTDRSALVTTPTLAKSYTDAPVLGETFTFQVPHSGPWHLDLRSYFFDAYLVLREGQAFRADRLRPARRSRCPHPVGGLEVKG